MPAPDAPAVPEGSGPAPSAMRLAPAAAALAFAGAGLSLALGAGFAVWGSEPALPLAVLGAVSGVLALRRRAWATAVLLGLVNAAVGVLTVVGFLLALASVGLLAGAREEFSRSMR